MSLSKCRPESAPGVYPGRAGARRVGCLRQATVLILALLPWVPQSGVGNAAPPAAVPDPGQIDAPLEWMPVPGDEAASQGLVLLLQRATDGRLLLTPNEAFFPRHGPRAAGEGQNADIDRLNGGRSFALIENWRPGDRAEWGLWLPREGEIQVRARVSGGRFSVSLGDQPVPLAADDPTPDGTGDHDPVATLQAPGAGRHSLFLTADEVEDDALFESLELSGPAIADSGVLRLRWRPAAAHARFTSSTEPERVRLWVMEMDAKPGDRDFYCPITTPFGYYGPTWLADGRVGAGVNFSLWSFRRNQPEPAVEQLSHLLAVGHREARFGGFDHEGTGVKVRGWDPLEGRQQQRQTFALRVEPGDPYDTYFSYFYAADEGRWRLFAAGNQFNDGRPLESLWVGSFVEVPGPPQRQRSGPYPRRMRYRGWVMDDEGRWHQLDRISHGNVDPATGLTHTDRGLTGDGWFFLQTGGWYWRRPPEGTWTGLPRSGDGLGSIDYLTPEAVRALTTVPSSIRVTSLRRHGTRVELEFEVGHAGDDPVVTVFHGPDEALTFADRWARRQPVPEVREGRNRFAWDAPGDGRPLHVRLLLENCEGRFWSTATRQAAP